MERERTRRFILAQCARYPRLRPADLIKGLHQSTFGCGHLIRDPAAAAEFIRREAEGCTAPNGPVVEALDGGFVRFHLWGLRQYGMSPEELAARFAASAEIRCGSVGEIEARLGVLLDLAAAVALPFSGEETEAAVAEWRALGYPACHHSEQFRAAYAPAYRVLRREQLPIDLREKMGEKAAPPEG